MEDHYVVEPGRSSLGAQPCNKTPINVEADIVTQEMGNKDTSADHRLSCRLVLPVSFTRPSVMESAQVWMRPITQAINILFITCMQKIENEIS